uniref:Methyltransf_FA domain-containing protein n=1 Tax=Anopheles maculatus TaxID=74869 RepID=A0A182SXZ6_9DIPT
MSFSLVDSTQILSMLDNVKNYNAPLDYFPTSSLQHIGRTNNSQIFKIGIQGRNNGIIRFGETLYPYSKSVIEIVIGGYENKKSLGRRQYRTTANKLSNLALADILTPDLLSPNRPTMLRVELFTEGTIQVSIDGQEHPFLSFKDSAKIPFNYMAFTKWEKDIVIFYDCPLERTNPMC